MTWGSFSGCWGWRDWRFCW